GGAIESDSGVSGFFGDLGQPTMTITRCSFTGNAASVLASADGKYGGSAPGGALDVEDRAAAPGRGGAFGGNPPPGGNGGSGADGGQALGGAISDFNASLTVSNSRFRGNATGGGDGGAGGGSGGFAFGGALFNGGGPLFTVRASDFSGN